MNLVTVCRAYCQARIRAKVKAERGASLVEYALLLALIAVVCIGAITLIGSGASKTLSRSASALE